MGKKKRQRFAELETFDHVIQPAFDEAFGKDHPIKGTWKSGFFHNDSPLTLELGCGKGEYTTGMARRFPDRNFVGIDIKGARIWRGAKTALGEQLQNVAFLRTRIEWITSFFAPDEVEEIWLTFPDPQLKKKRKRLTSAGFLNQYTRILKDGGHVHLKTDSQELFAYTLDLLHYNHLPVQVSSNDLYHSKLDSDLLGIQTFYERQFLEKGMKITYLCFSLPHEKPIEEPPKD
jgi:tRNA (guanine-N7-)-methyltransferase